MVFAYVTGAAAATKPLSIGSSQGTLAYTATASTTSGGSWLSVNPTSGNTPSSLSVLANPAGLPVGNYNGTVVINANTTTPGVSPSPATGSPQTVTVNMTVSQPPALVIGSQALSFNYQTGGSQPNGQTLTVGSTGSPLMFTAAANTYAGGGWLQVSQNGASTPASLNVTVIPGSLAPGTYSGAITITASGASNSPATVVVTLTVSATPTLILGDSALTFTYQLGGSALSGQTISVGSSGAALAFSATATTSSGGTWLSVNPTSSSTPANLSVAVNPAGLVAGSYNGMVTVTPTVGQSATATVTLTVQSAPSVSASPGTLSLTYQVGGAAPTAAVQVTGTAPNLSFTAAVTSSDNWLTVTPASGTTGSNGANLTVSVNPANLSAGIYNGTITVNGAGSATGVSIISVILTVTGPAGITTPTLTAVVNAGSYAVGAISPGEIVAIGGTGIGPSVPAFLTLDQNGNVATSLAGVQVLFNGILAPLSYVSSGQINAIVPYEIAGALNPSVQVRLLGQTSPAYPLKLATAAPGLFTLNSSGTGPAAALNQDNSINSPNNPAAKGSYVVLYMTGEGQTSPAGVTGKVTTVAANPPITPQSLLPVSVLINGQSALVAFYGESPGLVSGVMQLNVQIPIDAASGGLPLQVSIGGATSQSGVTISVQ
jgi:uncharacterized protein (TIGR03437 family)